MFGTLHWSIKMLVFFGGCFGCLLLMKFLEYHGETVGKVIRKVLATIADMLETACLVILALLAD